MKRKIIICLVTLFCTSILAACGKTKNSSEEASTSTTKKQEQKSYSFYQDAKNNSRIYYKTSISDDVSFGKDTKIEAIIYVDHGKYTYYATDVTTGVEPHTLGNLKGKSDKDILKLAVQWNKQMNEAYATKLEEEAQNVLNNNSNSIPGLSETIRLNKIQVAEKNIDLAKNYEYSEPKPKKLEIFVKEDATGNNVEKELIGLPANGSQVKFIFSLPKDGSDESEYIETNSYFSGNYLVGDSLKYYDITPTQGSGVVYEKTYSMSTFGKSILATEGTAIMKQDNLSEKGILDYSTSQTQYSIKNDAGLLNGGGDKAENIITWK